MAKGLIPETTGKTKVIGESTDGLTFLLDEQRQPGNVMVVSVNNHIIRDPAYTRRMVEVIYDAVPSGGVFICANSYVFESAASMLFAREANISRSYCTVYEKD